MAAVVDGEVAAGDPAHSGSTDLRHYDGLTPTRATFARGDPSSSTATASSSAAATAGGGGGVSGTMPRSDTPTSPASTTSRQINSTRARGTLGTAGRPPHHRQALSAIRAFLRRESCFDILPESFRLIVFDNKLLIKRALVALQTNGESEDRTLVPLQSVKL